MKKGETRTRRDIKALSDLSDLYNIHCGRKCFVVGAGPSLCFLDLSALDEHIVISVNSSILKLNWNEGISGFAPSINRYWISNDRLCVKWDYFWKSVLRSKSLKIVRTSWLKYDDKIRDHNFRYFAPRESEKMPLSDEDPGLCYVSSVPTAIDLAIRMGCSHIYLMGVDQAMLHGNSHFWQFWDKKKWPQRSDKSKNFRPEQKHQKVVFEENESVFQSLKEYAGRHGAVIKNCSNVSRIKTFEIISTDQALGE